MNSASRSGISAPVRSSEERSKLWKRFAATGRIEDYLAYSRFDGEKTSNSPKNSDRSQTP